MPKLPARQPSAPDDIDTALIETAEAMLAEHFFDPEAEDAYRQKLSAERQRMGESVSLVEVDVPVRGSDCVLRLDALRTWTKFRVSLDHKEFAAIIEGSWSFEMQELQKPQVSGRRGSREVWEEALDAIDESWFGDPAAADLGDFFGGGDQDDDDDDEDEDDDALLSEPEEPPPATATERARVKAIAKRLARDETLPISAEDRQWLEDTPQALPVITDALIAAAAEHGVTDPVLSAYGTMLSLEL